jgi:hypothetical protein
MRVLRVANLVHLWRRYYFSGSKYDRENDINTKNLKIVFVL